MPTYYNEIDPYAAQWLRNLIAAGQIAPGDVDERSIKEVLADDLEGYIQCHFFAGIGGWSYALRLAGWPDERPVWTGSVPCQPFSVAGKGAGTDDPRHLWPELCRLIRQRLPEHVIGEQVPGAIGRGWLDGVSADLEKEGYAVGSIVLGAHSVGAPHIRQRLWWAAQRLDDTTGSRRPGALQPETITAARNETRLPEPQRRGGLGRMAHANCPEGRDAEQSWEGFGEAQAGPHAEPRRRGDAGWMGNAAVAGLQDERREQGAGSEGRLRQLGSPSGDGFWDSAAWIPCGDGKARRVESGIHTLAHGATARVGRLRAYGNAIVPQVAAEFIRAFEEVRSNNHG